MAARSWQNLSAQTSRDNDRKALEPATQADQLANRLSSDRQSIRYHRQERAKRTENDVNNGRNLPIRGNVAFNAERRSVPPV